MRLTALATRVKLSSAAAPKLYVDPAGLGGAPSDVRTRAQAVSNPAAPFATLIKAIQESQAGDTIYCRTGTYGSWEVRGPNGHTGPTATELLGSKTQTVTIRPYPGDTVNVGKAKFGGCQNLVFDGVNFETLTMSYAVSTKYYAATDVIVRNFTCGATATPGSVYIGRSVRCTIENFEVIGPGAASNVTSGPGLNVGGDTVAFCQDVTIRNAVVHDFSDGVRIQRFKGLVIDGLEVYNVYHPSGAHPDAVQWFWTSDKLYPAENFTGSRIWIHDCTGQGWFSNMTVNGCHIDNMLIEPCGSSFTEAYFPPGDDISWANVTVLGTTAFTTAKTTVASVSSTTTPAGGPTPPPTYPDPNEPDRFTNARLVNCVLGAQSIATTLLVANVTGPDGFQRNVTYNMRVGGSISVEKGNLWTGGKDAKLGAIDAASASGAATYVDSASHDYRLAGGSNGKGIGVQSAGSGASAVTAPTIDRLKRARSLPRDPGSDQ